MVVVRQPADVPACVEALRDSHTVDRYPMAWPADPAAWLTPSRVLRCWVGHAEGEVHGHVALVDSQVGWVAISRLFVRPSSQGRGLAAELLGAALDHALVLGRRVTLDVIEDSTAAIRLYQRLGWTFVEQGPAPFTRPDGTRPTQLRYVAPMAR